MNGMSFYLLVLISKFHISYFTAKIYTDGSKKNEKLGCAVITLDKRMRKRLQLSENRSTNLSLSLISKFT
jgi:hypothetical protein